MLNTTHTDAHSSRKTMGRHFLRLLLQRAEFEGRNADCELLVGQCWKDDRNVN